MKKAKSKKEKKFFSPSEKARRLKFSAIRTDFKGMEGSRTEIIDELRKNHGVSQMTVRKALKEKNLI
jgi:predicted GNAT family acetyltransferase